MGEALTQILKIEQSQNSAFKLKRTDEVAKKQDEIDKLIDGRGTLYSNTFGSQMMTTDYNKEDVSTSEYDLFKQSDTLYKARIDNPEPSEY